MADRCSARTRVAFDSVFLPFHRIEEANILPLKRKVCVAAVASSMSQKSSMHASGPTPTHPSMEEYTLFPQQGGRSMWISSIYIFLPLFSAHTV
jgi:hypothetical protein